MRFLECTKGDKNPSKYVLDLGVDNVLMFSGVDEKKENASKETQTFPLEELIIPT
jgi:hypothetical protein